MSGKYAVLICTYLRHDAHSRSNSYVRVQVHLGTDSRVICVFVCKTLVGLIKAKTATELKHRKNHTYLVFYAPTSPPFPPIDVKPHTYKVYHQECRARAEVGCNANNTTTSLSNVQSSLSCFAVRYIDKEERAQTNMQKLRLAFGRE